jgi:Uma2 family endonuclease
MLANPVVYPIEDGSLLVAPRRPFTVDEYHLMAEAGILHEDDRLELLEGDIVPMSPVGIRHMACVNRLNDLFTHRLRRKAIVSVQNPVRLGDESEPQPDIALLKYQKDYYARQMPTAADVLLIIEVADSTMPFDRKVKHALYARALIPEYWIVNLIDNQIEVYRQPENGRYAQKLVVNYDGVVTAVAFPNTPFPVTDLIG